jgi:spore photoproduct lyase
VLKDTAPEKWEYREHTKVKHILLRKYLVAWIPILGRWNPKICYFDGFAGRGEYTDGILGSPLIALEVADSLSHYFGKLTCFFIEKDSENFKNLERVLEREKSKFQNWQKIKIEKENDEFANVINGIFEYLEKEKSILVPSFFFVDPFGFSGIPFTAIKKILENPKTEVFFTFMVRDIARFIQLPELENIFNKLFGTNKWRNILDSSQKPELALMNLYREQLHEAANAKYSCPFRVCTSEKIQTLYYLLHVTNNFKGHSIMKNIMFKQSAEGNFAYLGPEEVIARTQMRLFDVHSIQDLKKYLLERFKGKSLGYEEIQEQVCTPWHTEPPYIDPHYRKALKELEKEGKVKVNRITSKTKRGLGGEDIITFLQHNPSTLTLHSPSLPKLKLHYKEYALIDGKRQVLVERVNDGSIITRFDKTPLPKKPTDVICPHFIELKWAYGCPYDCAWCYLKGTFRFRPEGIKPVIKDYKKIESHVKRFLEEESVPEILNTGEIADSLMGENGSKPFSKFIIPIFESQKIHKVLFLTKSSNIKNLLELDSHNQVIMSFSLNAIPVAGKWEKAPKVMRRLEAAKKLYEAGFEVRVRIDPMVPVENWEKHYIHLIDLIFGKFSPERITLGSLRGLQSTINGCTDKSWAKYLSESSNWGKKVDINQRLAMYKKTISYLAEKYNYCNVSLCKETKAIWGILKLDYKKIKCNCVW